MASFGNSILSTHSGHHRIFIGPIVLKHHNHSNSNEPTSHQGQAKSFHSHHANARHSTQAAVPKPWWVQGSSFLKSHTLPHQTSTPTTAPVPGTTPTSPAPSAIPNAPLQQTSIPQLSYTFSDHSSDESHETDDEDPNAFDSEDERRDYEQDNDEDGEDERGEREGHRKLEYGPDRNKSVHPFQISTSTASASSNESLSARVGHSLQGYHGTSEHSDPTQGRHELPHTGDSAGGWRTKGPEVKGKERAAEDNNEPIMATATRWSSKEKKRTKSMRDEGEPNRLKKFFGHHRKARPHEGDLDNPDLGWESEGSRMPRPRPTRQMSSGALIVGQQHLHKNHHPVLVGSPLSSVMDLPATNHPVYVSSPVSSMVDVSKPENLERPDPIPIQNLPPEESGVQKSDHLGPAWKPSSSSVKTLSTPSSPINSNIRRGATWVTARESVSSVNRDSLYGQALEEENEEDEDDADEHYSLAKVISRESDSGAGIRPNGQAEGAIRTSQESKEKTMEELAVSDTASQKEPLSTTISKASTRFGRALLNRSPTGMKRQSDMPIRTSVQPVESICSIDKGCQLQTDSPVKKKHVRFLTKVQYQIKSSREPTLLSTHPVVKQDRMLVRKEVTERSGPHVYNSDTARRLERMSQGWKEWWCVMKGPPTDSKPPVKRIRRRSKADKRIEKGRLEFYYNHKKINGTVVLSSCTSVSVYSSLDYSIAVTQNYPEALGLTVYILRPRTISLACAWYMDIYTLLNGNAPIPPFIEIAVPDFDVKIRVPIPEDSDSGTDDDDDLVESIEDEDEDEGMGTALSSTLPFQEQQDAGQSSTTTPHENYRTAASDLPTRMLSKTFYLTDDNARPQLVAPDEVTPKLLRSHVLSLLKDVPDWTEVVKIWQDPGQYGDVALCWKRYDRIEWIYWNERVLSETNNLHLQKGHIGFADGSEWTGRMDWTVVGPQVLDKTHLLELRPITHYPSKAKIAGGQELHEPDPIEGYLVRVSTFAGNPIRRFRRLYLTSHDHMLIYTVPSESHSPTMQHAGSIDPLTLVFCITPHRSANPDHKDMSQSRSLRRLKAQVKAARGFIDMTKIEAVRVLTVREWETMRHVSYKKSMKGSKRERLGKAVMRATEAVEEAGDRARTASASHQVGQQEQEPQVIEREPDNYFFPTILVEPESLQQQTAIPGSNSQQQQQQRHGAANGSTHELHGSEPLNNSLRKKLAVNGHTATTSLREGFIKSATFVADVLLHNDTGNMDNHLEDSNVIEVEMKGGPCVRFRAFSPEAAHLWCDQLQKLAEYWKLRKHLDIKEHMYVSQANCQLASSLDTDEIQLGETIQDWDNDRAMVSPGIWNWCVVNGCRSITKSGMVYYKPKLHSTFRRMFLVLTEGYLMLFHPHRRSKTTGQLVPTTVSKLASIHSLMDIYIYSGHFSDEDTVHGTNDESERLPRYFPDGLIVDDPDEDCTFSIWRGKRRRMLSRRGPALLTMSARAVSGSSKVFGKDGLLSSIVKDGVVYGSAPRSCGVFRARSRPDLEEWVFAINNEIERVVRAERRRIRFAGRS
ncbi:Pleckstrin homology domain-containing protein [Gamsiella multidivaricata]|uniref:Pleckstrin homology domain-containing protein n=1 Tax=Gamsiella multidivaricata TaxID=101098 RepID=UPI0022204294|nr:Pleckstrin homology domain-containing protein [Gamsiella multidivaricata]KAG0362363.1 hypothetical protein BGZ54_008654 [Gamsiella multidivaricata]KAI7832519.1 Pleckstrin homology domain-containing protein [Gamsiella multidivaricata]